MQREFARARQRSHNHDFVNLKLTSGFLKEEGHTALMYLPRLLRPELFFSNTSGHSSTQENWPSTTFFAFCPHTYTIQHTFDPKLTFISTLFHPTISCVRGINLVASSLPSSIRPSHPIIPLFLPECSGLPRVEVSQHLT